MKKVLIIGHLPRASQRVMGLAQYLPEFGWEAVILSGATAEGKNLPARIVATPYRDALGWLGRWLKPDSPQDARQQIKSRLGITAPKSPLDFLLSLGGEIINYPCPDKNWQPFAVKAGRQLLQAEKIDALISSSPPVISHIIARELKATYGIPWVADFRDLWSQNHNYSYSAFRRLLDKRLERQTIAPADALVTVSQPWAEQLNTLHQSKVTYAITNGFDPLEVNDPPVALTAKFTITYTGLIYTGKQDPTKLFAAMSELIAEGLVNPAEVEIRFYGPEINWLPKESDRYGLSGIVKHYGAVPPDIARQKQRESQLLLLLNWEDQRIKGWHPLKGFEYLAAQRPIIATGGSGDDVTKVLLEETKAGIYCRTAADVKKALTELYSEYQHSGRISYRGDISQIGQYSHRAMAQKFSAVLERLAQSRPQTADWGLPRS